MLSRLLAGCAVAACLIAPGPSDAQGYNPSLPYFRTCLLNPQNIKIDVWFDIYGPGNVHIMSSRETVQWGGTNCIGYRGAVRSEMRVFHYPMPGTSTTAMICHEKLQLTREYLFSVEGGARDRTCELRR